MHTLKNSIVASAGSATPRLGEGISDFFNSAIGVRVNDGLQEMIVKFVKAFQT